MKHGKRPTRSQRQEIKEHGLNAENWLVVKDTPDALEIVHRFSDDARRTIVRSKYDSDF